MIQRMEICEESNREPHFHRLMGERKKVSNIFGTETRFIGDAFWTWI